MTSTVNLFTSAAGSYLSAVGFGALMGILKNYEIIAPFASANNDASALQLQIQAGMEVLDQLYREYEHNLI